MKKDKTFRPDRVLSYFKAEWLPLVFVTLSGLVYNIGLLATPWFEGRLAQCLADILGGSETAAKMAMLVLAYIVVTLAVQAARFIKRFYVRRFANNINRRMKGILYANLVRQSRAALEKEGAGELMTKAISDVDDCVEGMRKFTTEIFDTGVALAAGAAQPAVHAVFLHVRGMDEKAGAARRCGVQKGGKCAERCHPRPRPECCDLPHLRL
jgi:ATP-binding cassette subfamily B protein